jgi:hypothetical protein
MQKARFLHLALLGATVSYLVFLAIVDFIQMIPVAPVDDLVLRVLVVVLVGVGAISVALASFLPRLMSRQMKTHFIRGAILESVAIYGLVLGLVGAGWAVVMPFFIVSIGALILTFPTNEQ